MKIVECIMSEKQRGANHFSCWICVFANLPVSPVCVLARHRHTKIVDSFYLLHTFFLMVKMTDERVSYLFSDYFFFHRHKTMFFGRWSNTSGTRTSVLRSNYFTFLFLSFYSVVDARFFDQDYGAYMLICLLFFFLAHFWCCFYRFTMYCWTAALNLYANLIAGDLRKVWNFTITKLSKCVLYVTIKGDLVLKSSGAFKREYGSSLSKWRNKNHFELDKKVKHRSRPPNFYAIKIVCSFRCACALAFARSLPKKTSTILRSSFCMLSMGCYRLI